MLKSKGRLGFATLACVNLAIAIATPAAAWDRGSVQNFLVPSGPMVEGLTVDSNGNVYTPTFNPTGSGNSKLYTFDHNGNLLNNVTITGSSPAMLGLAFRPLGPPKTNELLVIDFGAGQVLSVDPNSGNAKPCITLPNPTIPPTAGLNALTFDNAGNIYVSDSFQGVIWRYSPLESGSPCGQATAWVTDPLLLPFVNKSEQPQSVPPFGANGVEFNNEQNAMFVCNTAIDTIVEIPFSGGTGGNHGTPAVFTNSINGCDGIAIDKSDNIWAAPLFC
jgi:sugar lactone lactonase YvrE